MQVLVDLDWADPARLELRAPAGQVLGLFDGHVRLEPECFRQSGERGVIGLNVPPAFAVKALVEVGSAVKGA